jgi:glucose-6-phosphate dehydrogenase assembly protein OpcA
VEDPLSSTAVRPEQLLKELSGLWTQLGKEEIEGSDRSAGVLRAVTMTFLLGVDEGDDEAAAGEALAQLMHEHPSRAIVLKLKKQSDSQIEGRAFAQCWMPFGRRQQICCEQIELSAGQQSFADIISLLRGLIAPDLPVVFWCRSPRLFEHPAFAQVAAMADKVILDSRNHPNPIATTKSIDQQLKLGHLYSDLTWTRLTRWRETVSGVFERIDCQGFLSAIHTAVIEYSHSPEPMASVYLAAWLHSVFGLQFPVKRTLVPSEISWQIRAIRFETPLTDVVIDRSEKGIVEAHIKQFTARSVFEVLDEARLVREELSIFERDPFFARAVEIVSQS